jgi:hypothetical protein
VAVEVQRTAWSAVEVLRSLGGRGGEDFMYTLLIISYQLINSCRCVARRLYQHATSKLPVSWQRPRGWRWGTNVGGLSDCIRERIAGGSSIRRNGAWVCDIVKETFVVESDILR